MKQFIQNLLEKFKFKSPAVLVSVLGVLAGAKYFLVNQTLGGFHLPEQAVETVVGLLGGLLAVHSTGTVNAKAAAAVVGFKLPVWIEAPIAKFLADFKVKNARTWLWITTALMTLYFVVKYSLTSGWSLSKVIVDAVLTVVPFLLSSQTTGVIALETESK